MNQIPRLIAFYLPQYHPIPENDEWWGIGFTEWTNTAKAKPLFRGHYQPHVPSDLGFYDLRVPETREAQAQMARQHGIEAFCYYHYWFAGRRLLERPFNEVLESGQPNFPFCLCWANQTWSGVWHGNPSKVLIEQTYPGEEDYRAHFNVLLPAFKDDRYLKVDGMPMFVVYQPDDIPKVNLAMEFWQQLAREAGLPGLYLVGVHLNPNWNPTTSGFHAAITPNLPSRRGWVSRRNPIKWLKNRYEIFTGKPTIHEYKNVVLDLIPDSPSHIKNYPCLIPNWDNTPRSGYRGLVLHDSTPNLFRGQVRKALAKVSNYSPEEKIIFIKSWNEWAEGNYLEPDLKYGKAYLEVVRDEINSG